MPMIIVTIADKTRANSKNVPAVSIIRVLNLMPTPVKEIKLTTILAQAESATISTRVIPACCKALINFLNLSLICEGEKLEKMKRKMATMIAAKAEVCGE